MLKSTPTKSMALAALMSLSSLGACKNPAKDVPAAKVATGDTKVAAESSKHVAKDGNKNVGAKTIELNGENTTIEFIGSKVTGSHPGGFKTISGSVVLSGDKLEATQANITIDMKSTFSDSDKLTEHLMSPDFFDVEKFPRAVFDINSISAAASGGMTHTVSGELTFHGVAKPISFPANVSNEEKLLKANAEFSINRKDFGIEYPGMKDDLIRDEVVIKLTLNLSKS